MGLTPSSISLTAPAKINLSLRILSPRKDGYHEIETLMAPLALADHIELQLAPEDSEGSILLTCNDTTLPVNEENLCVQAVQIFQKKTNLSSAVTISLTKEIPHGAGLGGGSSDAAAVLQGMNRLFDSPLNAQELHTLATTLGSDVPFFLDPKARWCRGRGEELGASASLPAWKMILIKPSFLISAAEAYARLKGKTRPAKRTSQMVDGIEIFNDLEAAVFTKYLQLPTLQSLLQAHPAVACAWMTGSGSTLVAALHKDTSQKQIASLQTMIASKLGPSFWVRETTFV